MKKMIYYVVILILVQSCKKTSEDIVYSVDTTGESAQQVGDVMASTDESGGSTSGLYAINSSDMQSTMKAYARISKDELNTVKISDLFLPEAQAAACNTIAFTGCSANKRIRTFDGCTVGTAGSITGNITLTFSDAACSAGSSSQTVKRVPNFTVTGLRGATFNVSATTANGQILTRGAGTASTFANEGIRRTFVTPKGATILDVTTTTGTAINVTGTNRTGRTMSGGSLILTNNLTNEICTLTPSTSPVLTWTGGCSCPTQGFWSGTCSPSSKTFKVTFGATCGEVTVENTGETTQTVTLDRCGA